MIIIKSARELAIMRQAGKIASDCFKLIASHMRPGVTTLALDSIVEKFILSAGAEPSFKGYAGYPASICASVNETLIHGIPNARALQSGDIISIDLGVKYKGYHVDTARTYCVGDVPVHVKQLVDVTEAAFFKALEVIRPGAYISDISHTIQSYVEPYGYGLPEDYSGHGVGQSLHEDPSIPNVGLPGQGPILKKGMTLAIEPMVHLGKKETIVLDDGWTVQSADGSLTAHYEHTIVVTEQGVEILTLQQGG